MIVRDEELNILVGNVDGFESLIHHLIRAEARVCGICPDQINWDYRSSVKDGGRDVMILTGNSRADRLYIPPTKSIWSSKSGKDGLKPSKLDEEIRNHPKVISHLQEGGAYIWCVAAANSNNDRDEWHNKGAELAKEFGFAEEQIRFFFRDTLTAWLNEHPGLIAVHLPNLPRGWKSLMEWKRLDRNRNISWVSFGDRAQLVTEIRQHLLSTTQNNVLHLAGWSGIGKTRTTLQACEDPSLAGVFYFPTFDSFTTEFEDYLTRNESINAAIVIDEVSIDEFSSLQSRLSEFQQRLRVVTIGAGTSKSIGSRESVIEVSIPDSVNDVAAVIQSADASLTTKQAQNIAAWCDHDLRLALLLTEANKRDPGLAKQPITSVDDVWLRVINLFEQEIGDTKAFRDHYEILSLCLDVGNQDQMRGELEYLAKYFDKPVAELDRSIARACDCGLGRQQGRFFEATPRALARRIFERWGWSLVKSDALSFFSMLPTERLQRRFIERVQECDQQTRGEADKHLNDWLLLRFPQHDILLLSDREASRIFAEYTETNPHKGLPWLRQAVEEASPEQLLAFNGDSDFSGGWRGRRQIVWLCEHLAQFPECFWDCETILFRLAQYETETCANNSKGVWQDLFLPELSNTPLPFDQRWQHLMKRLSETTELQLPLIMDAALESLRQNLEDFISGTGLPEIVGGRRVPPMWHAANPHEREKLASTAARQFIDRAQLLSPEDQQPYREAIFNYLITFLYLGCLDLLRDWFVPEEMTDEEIRRLRRSLDRYINWLLVRTIDRPQWHRQPSEYEKQWATQALEHVKPWRASLNPKTLQELIIDITSRRLDQQVGSGIVENFDDRAIYDELSAEILKAPAILSDLCDWFNSGKPVSAYELGRALGRLDHGDLLQWDLLKHLAQGRCVDFVTGYFDAIYWSRKIAPAPLVEVLDTIADTHPEIALYVTLRTDVSTAGFQRLLRVAPHSKGTTYKLLEEISCGQAWPRLLTEEQKAQTISLLVQIGERTEEKSEQAYDLALEMLCHWTPPDSKFSQELADAVFVLLKKSLPHQRSSNQSFYWNFSIGKLPASHSSQRIELLVDAIVEGTNLREDAIQRLDQLARTSLEAVTSVVEAKIAMVDKQDYLLLGDLLCIFDFTNLGLMQRLVRPLGVYGARALAGHLPSPFPTTDDPMNVPPITAWLLDEFSEDDQVFGKFCAGTHHGQMLVGRWANYFADTEEKMTRYLKHPLRRIREWAENEISYANGMIDWDDQMERERGRT